MKKFKVGDKVIVVDNNMHKLNSSYYPCIGTIGIVTEIYPMSIRVQWPKGSTSGDDNYYIPNKYIELYREENMFTKDMLKTGHIVTVRDGRKMLVMRDSAMDGRDWFIDKRNSALISFDNYDDDLKSVYADSKGGQTDIDIMKVETVKNCREMLNFLQKNIKFELVWERKEDLNLTVAVCKHQPDSSMEFWFEVPKEHEIKKGAEVLVDTKYGEQKAHVEQVLFFKTQKDLDDYLKLNDVSGPTFPLKKVVGVINRL